MYGKYPAGIWKLNRCTSIMIEVSPAPIPTYLNVSDGGRLLAYPRTSGDRKRVCKNKPRSVDRLVGRSVCRSVEPSTALLHALSPRNRFECGAAHGCAPTTTVPPWKKSEILSRATRRINARNAHGYVYARVPTLYKYHTTTTYCIYQVTTLCVAKCWDIIQYSSAHYTQAFSGTYCTYCTRTVGIYTNSIVLLCQNCRSVSIHGSRVLRW